MDVVDNVAEKMSEASAASSRVLSGPPWCVPKRGRACLRTRNCPPGGTSVVEVAETVDKAPRFPWCDRGSGPNGFPLGETTSFEGGGLGTSVGC